MKKCILKLVGASVALLCFQNVTAQVVNGSPFWSLQGNSNAAFTSKLGTTTAVPLRLVTNGELRLIIRENSGNVGIGTSVPERRLHVFNGSAGAVISRPNAPLVVENNTACYINLLAPQANESGILFGNPGNAADAGVFYFSPSDAMQFRTNGNITRMTLSGIGNLGIGTTAPTKKLHVRTTTASGTRAVLIQNLSGGTFNDGLEIQAGTNTGSGSWYAVFKRPDGISIGRISQASATSVSYNTTSDKRLKANIHVTKYGLADLKKIEVKDYNFFDSKEEHTGFLAQQLYEVFPEAVSVGGDDPKERPWMVDYGRITPLLVKAVQEQQDQIDQQQQQINQQQQQIDELKNLVSKLSGTSNFVTGVGSLGQNTPNPARTNTRISYSIPEGSKKAYLLLSDALGRTIRTFTLNASGIVNIDASVLSSGSYSYSMIIDGKTILTRKMVVVK